MSGEEEHSKVSRINLIDLAGSERSTVAQTCGDRLKVSHLPPLAKAHTPSLFPLSHHSNSGHTYSNGGPPYSSDGHALF